MDAEVKPQKILCLQVLKTFHSSLSFDTSFIIVYQIFYLGSYDHTVRMFDTRTNTASIVVNHGCPVESVLAFPSGSILLSAGIIYLIYLLLWNDVVDL